MTKTELRTKEKNAIIRAMVATAEQNGKEVSFDEMEVLAKRLHRHEATLQRLAEDECNRPVYDEAKQDRIETLVKNLITEMIGCKNYTQRDPRGFCIRMYLVNEDGQVFTNSWDGETTGLAW